MKILVTGAKEFVGKNLCSQLKNIQEHQDKVKQSLKKMNLTNIPLLPI